MPKKLFPQRALVTFLINFLLLVSPFTAFSQSSQASEYAQLNLLIRQLDMLERTAHQSQIRSQSQTSRYHFDYERLHTDIALIRTGIHDYLTPRRAQPRDMVEISGHYVVNSKEER